MIILLQIFKAECAQIHFVLDRIFQTKVVDDHVVEPFVLRDCQNKLLVYVHYYYNSVQLNILVGCLDSALINWLSSKKPSTSSLKGIHA